MRGPALAMRTGRSFNREDPDPPVGPPPRRGESVHQPRRNQEASQAAPPVLGLGLEAIQGMTNAMNAIANQVIRSSGRSGRNAGWPYFDGTYRDYPALRKFESFRMTYHRGTPTQELFQQFREMCLPEKLSVKIKSANNMENAWVRLDAWFGDKALFIKDLMQDIKGVAQIKDGDDERMMDYYVTLLRDAAGAHRGSSQHGRPEYATDTSECGVDGAPAHHVGEEDLERGAGQAAC